MPCLLGCLALFVPRVVLVLVFVFTDLLQHAYHTVLWPFLGFIFMPLTTLAYAWAMVANGGSVSGFYLIVVVVAVLVDLGLVGGGASQRRRYRSV